MIQTLMQSPVPRVVVVEDDAAILELLRELLSAEDLQVVALPHPQLVAGLDTGLRIDLFLIDMMLPGESGMDLVTRLRASGFPHTPMIALSASQSLLRTAMASGQFAGAVAKPFDLLDLLSCVKRHAGMSCYVGI